MKLFRLRVLCIVHLRHFKCFSAPDNNKGLVDRKTQHFIRSENRTLADTAGFPIFWRVVGNTPGTKLFCFAGDIYTGEARAFRDKFRC